MKLKTILALSISATAATTSLFAQQAKPKSTFMINVEAEDDDEHECEDDEDFEMLDIKQVRAWLKQNAKWALEDFEEILKEKDEELMDELLMELNDLIHEHKELSKFDPKLGKLHLEITEREHTLDTKMSLMLEGGKKRDHIKKALKKEAQELVKFQIKLAKGRIKMEIKMLQEELAELEKEGDQLDDNAEELLDELLEFMNELEEMDEDEDDEDFVAPLPFDPEEDEEN